MAYRDDSGREPYRQYSTTGRSINSRVPSVSDYGDENQPYHHASTPAPRPGHLQTSIDSYGAHPNPYDPENGNLTYSPASWAGTFDYSNRGGTHTPAASTGTGPSRQPSRLSRMSSYTSYASTTRQPTYESLGGEEEYDLSLMQTAAPMGRAPRYEAIAEEEHVTPGFDVSAALGPSGVQDEEFMRSLQQQEAKGTLTGGLGAGFRPDSTMRDADLLSSPTAVNRSLSRSFSRRNSRLGRAETLRYKGQDEANRRGEVIEVIVEDPGTDLSLMEGPSGIAVDEVRRATFPIRKQTTQIFYPQPNWKPFSMRWPYLLILILISIALAAAQEILFRKFEHGGILEFTSPDEVDPGLYFAIKFLPTLCAVIYGVLWQFTDFEVRRLEAFYQLSKEGGALASESINVDYVTSFNFFRPIRALKLGHYAVALSSVAALLAVSLVPTFAAASVILTPGRRERIDHPDDPKTVCLAPVWSRLLTATLSICAIAGCGLMYLLQTRRSGLLADVRGIAGLASMAVVCHILMDFKDMDTAKHKDIHQRLKYHRYMLRNSSLAPDDENKSSAHERTGYDDETHLPENPHPLMLRPAGCISFVVGLILFAGFIPTFLFTPADVITDKAPWVVTALAVILKLCWGGMETAVRMMEPYYILWKRHAPSKTLTLDYSALPFGYMPLRALLNGHFLVFLVGFGSVMAEFLTIMVTSLATVEGQDFILDYKNKAKNGADWKNKSHLINSGQETVLSFYMSLGAALFVLLYMTVVATIVFFRRRHPFLPRQPNTIASVLAFIHQSKMLYDFVGTAKLSNAEMVKKLEDGKTYGLGWFEGRDGQIHCGVDQEELYSDYKHGLDVTQGINPWNSRWDVL